MSLMESEENLLYSLQMSVFLSIYSCIVTGIGKKTLLLTA